MPCPRQLLQNFCTVKMRKVVLAAGFDLPLPSFQTSNSDVRAMYLGLCCAGSLLKDVETRETAKTAYYQFATTIAIHWASFLKKECRRFSPRCMLCQLCIALIHPKAFEFCRAALAFAGQRDHGMGCVARQLVGIQQGMSWKMTKID